MALAYVSILDSAPGRVELLADIGTNVYYHYRIGSASSEAELDRIDFESPLQKHEQGAFAQPLRFSVPASHVPRGSRHLQLLSYRDAQRNGPAWSRVVALQSFALAGAPGEWSDLMSLERQRRAPARANPAFSARPAGALARASATRLAASLQVALRDGESFDVFGERLAVFRRSSGIGIDVDISGVDGHLPRAIAEVVLVDPANGATCARAETRLSQVATGAALNLRIEAPQLAKAPQGTRLRADVVVRWPTPAGVRRASASLPVLLAEGFFVVDVKEHGGRRLVPEDPERQRAFWHRIWAWAVPSDAQAIRWEVDFACRYALEPDGGRSTNGRRETRALLDEADPEALTYELAGKLKSGLQLSLDALHGLLGEGRLSSAELATIEATPRCVQKLTAQVTTRLRAKGKRANELVIWAVPAFEARTLGMLQIDATDQNGRVTSAAHAEHELPFPTKVRFITLRSVKEIDESAPFPGFEIASDDTASVEAGA